MSHGEPYILFVMPHELMLHVKLCDMSHMFMLQNCHLKCSVCSGGRQPHRAPRGWLARARAGLVKLRVGPQPCPGWATRRAANPNCPRGAAGAGGQPPPCPAPGSPRTGLMPGMGYFSFSFSLKFKNK
jgi:hypothetical protein